MKQFLITFVLVTGVLSVVNAQFPTAKCEIIDYWNTTCSFSTLQLTRTSYRFTPEADNFDLREVRISVPSKVVTVGPDICDHFVNLKVFQLDPNTGVEEFSPDATQNCFYVSEFQMPEQSGIKSVSRQLFGPMKWLEYINWTHSVIEEIPEDSFDGLTSMWSVTWTQGALKTFPPSLFKSFQRLNMLDIESNELTDLIVEEILPLTPNFQYIRMDDNPIKCSRLQVIKQVLRERKVSLSQVRNPKNRSPPLSRDNEGFLCVQE